MGTALPMVQLNVRMRRDLRDRGNEALASAGYSPSEMVRLVWEKAALRGHDLQEMLRVVAPASQQAEAIGADAHTEAPRGPYDQMRSLLAQRDDLRAAYAFRDAPYQPTDRDQEAEAIYEHYLAKEHARADHALVPQAAAEGLPVRGDDGE